MNKREEQREETRTKILEAALQVFSDRGFAGAGTREIANLAGVNQGLITYHFKSKDVLWREAANKIFTAARESVAGEAMRNVDSDPSVMQSTLIKAYVRFVASHPELLRFMVEEGKQPSERVRWLVDTHLKPMYENLPFLASASEDQKPHIFYAMIGAASLMFAVRPVCKRLTGVDPKDDSVIEAHAEFVAGLLVR
ncbi:MAG: TetR/AcrR family transcriptional regulator [Limisphaerales bacterium]|jgi:TetR/AcrR family transcriptional regulator